MFPSSDVADHNRVAIATHERMGFSSHGSILTDIGGGFQMNDYLMPLDL